MPNSTPRDIDTDPVALMGELKLPGGDVLITRGSAAGGASSVLIADVNSEVGMAQSPRILVAEITPSTTNSSTGAAPSHGTPHGTPNGTRHGTPV